MPVVLATMAGMTAVPLGEARDRLSEYVADVERTHERVTITRHGHPAAVLISADDLGLDRGNLGDPWYPPALCRRSGRGRQTPRANRFADNDEIKTRYGVA